MPVERMIILPGMDGSGELLLEFMQALPGPLRKAISTYVPDVVLSYEQLTTMVRSLCEDSPPFALMAESFSTPLAIRIAAERPANLRGLILCAGFASSPAQGIKRRLASALAPLLMRVPLTERSIRSRLVGQDTPAALVSTVREMIASVKPAVLSARLREVLACDVRADLRRIAVPMLYLRARHDRLVRPRCLSEIRRIRPEIRAVTVDGPHLLLQREPQKTAQIVADFVARLP